MKKTCLVLLLVVFLVATLTVMAAPAEDYAVFVQVDNERKTLYVSNPDGSDLQTVISGDNIQFFAEGRHLLYFSDHQLYEYNLVSRNSKLLTKFTEARIAIRKLSDEPDQAVIVAGNDYEVHWYIIDFPDGGARRIEEPSGLGSGQNTTLKEISPQGEAMVNIKSAAMENRFHLVVQERVNGKFKISWSSPKKMSVIPDFPVWAPNSRMIAFFGKDAEGVEGFYSLYVLDLDAKKLVPVQKQVFSKMFFDNTRMGTFTPNWSHDSKYLIFQYRPFGLPTESSIIKYEVSTGKEITLTNSSGNNENPVWSPSGRNILFLSDREGSKNQLYTMDEQGEHVKRLSPAGGNTEWAKWWKL
jgi:Tol biopolymer transport system component